MAFWNLPDETEHGGLCFPEGLINSFSLLQPCSVEIERRVEAETLLHCYGGRLFSVGGSIAPGEMEAGLSMLSLFFSKLLTK